MRIWATVERRSESRFLLRPRRVLFIPGSLSKRATRTEPLSGTLSMVHDTSRKLNRSRGRVITGVSVKSKRRLDARALEKQRGGGGGGGGERKAEK